MPFTKGHIHSPETRLKLSRAGQGRTAWNKGLRGVTTPWNKGLVGAYTPTAETRQRVSQALSDEKSSTWKGDAVSYSGLHKWVNKKLGRPGTCSHCGTSGLSGHKIHWANVSRTYQRDLNDWIRLCVGCHNNFDRGR